MKRRLAPKPPAPPDDCITVPKDGRFVPAYKQNIVSQARMSQPGVPDWRRDPTYNLRRRKP